jgi:hypothetical protein
MAPEIIVYLVVGLLIFGSVFSFAIRLLVGYAAFKRQKAFLEDYQRRVAEAAAQVPQPQPGQIGTVHSPAFDPNNFHTPSGSVVGGHVVIPGISHQWKH